MRDTLKRITSAFMETWKSNPKRSVFFVSILLLGIFARVYQFGGVPGDINQDEAFAGYNAYTLMQYGSDSYGYRMPVYLTAWGSGMNALESYLMIPFVFIFGLSVWAIRLPMLIIGILTLIATYKLVLRFSNERFALGSMFMVAISPWHIMLSRWALESNLAPGFVLFGIYFFAKSLEKQKFLILSAACFGLSLYAYATIWAVVPFIIAASILYAVWTHSLRLSRYLWISLGILALLGIPLFLFLLVNKGIIAEIKLPFLSIPKLVYFRDSEISFAKIPENLANLWNILTRQTDGLPWNATRSYGIFYPGMLAFAFVGLAGFLWKSVQDIRKRRLGLSVFIVIWLLAGLTIGALIHVNINRVNLLFLPILILIAHGIFYALDFIHPKAFIIIAVALLVNFAGFEKEYFTTYRDSIGEHFCEGIGDAMELATSRMEKGSRMVVDPNTSYPRILFYGKVDLKSYLSTVSYTNFPSAFLYVNSFDRYIFTNSLNSAQKDVVYLLENSEHRMNTLRESGFTVRNFGKYIVGYRE